MKKLAFVSGLQLFPAQSGGMLRSTSLARALAFHGFEVQVYSLVGRKADYLARRPSAEVRVGERLTEYVDRNRTKAAVQFASYRLDLPPLWIPEYLRLRTPPALKERLRGADAVLADFPYLARVFERTDRPKVLNTHNLEHHLLPGDGPRALVRARVKRLEEDAGRAADVVACCAEGDADFFRAAGAREVLLVPNGIDVTRFEAARPKREATRRALGVAADETLLLFPASRFGPNKEAFDWLVAQVEQRGPELVRRKVKLCVVGSVVGERVQKGPLTATGRVDEVEPYFAAADFALNPMFSGAGTNVKMADFIAARLPILTTGFGARGFLLEPDTAALVFEAGGFIEALDVALALGAKDRQAMARAAYEANARAIDMNRCAEPLVRWLSARA